MLEDRRLRIEHKRLLISPYLNKNLIKIVDYYLSDYASFNNLTSKNILQIYSNFVSIYYVDIKKYISTRMYPCELGKKYVIDRIDYDISLLLSIVVTIHRHRIMDNLIKYCSDIVGKVLLIGIGSGFELELLNIFCPNVEVEAYDISLSSFVQDRFKKNNIIKGKFEGRSSYYDHIIVIELLEHLVKPYSLISVCNKSLEKEGKFVFTLATNIPQFDHLYNFDDEYFFKNQMHGIGFVELEKENISHNYMDKNIHAKNTWYVFKKT